MAGNGHQDENNDNHPEERRVDPPKTNDKDDITTSKSYKYGVFNSSDGERKTSVTSVQKLEKFEHLKLSERRTVDPDDALLKPEESTALKAMVANWDKICAAPSQTASQLKNLKVFQVTEASDEVFEVALPEVWATYTDHALVSFIAMMCQKRGILTRFSVKEVSRVTFTLTTDTEQEVFWRTFWSEWTVERGRFTTFSDPKKGSGLSTQQRARNAARYEIIRTLKEFNPVPMNMYADRIPNHVMGMKAEVNRAGQTAVIEAALKMAANNSVVPSILELIRYLLDLDARCEDRISTFISRADVKFFTPRFESLKKSVLHIRDIKTKLTATELRSSKIPGQRKKHERKEIEVPEIEGFIGLKNKMEKQVIRENQYFTNDKLENYQKKLQNISFDWVRYADAGTFNADGSSVPYSPYMKEFLQVKTGLKEFVDDRMQRAETIRNLLRQRTSLWKGKVPNEKRSECTKFLQEHGVVAKLVYIPDDDLQVVWSSHLIMPSEIKGRNNEIITRRQYLENPELIPENKPFLKNCVDQYRKEKLQYETEKGISPPTPFHA